MSNYNRDLHGDGDGKFKYNQSAILVLASLRDSGQEVKVNRKQALAILRDMLAGLTFSGASAEEEPCPLTTALTVIIDTSLLSVDDRSRILRAYHRLIGLST